MNIHTIDEQVVPYIGTLFPGCIIGCANAEKHYIVAYGEHGDGVSTSEKDYFDIASVTKAMLNVATLKTLDPIDVPVSDHVTMSGKYRDRITVRHLLSFGVEYGDGIKLSQLTDRASLIDAVTNGDLPIRPGTSYRYTNISSMLLSMYLEQRFAMTFEQFLTQTLFDPLHMEETMFAHALARKERPIIPTERLLGRGVLQDESARLYGQPTGSAGLFSTMRDLLKFGQSFLGTETFLKKETITQMGMSQFGQSTAMTFGLGMGLRHQNECDLTDQNGIPLTVLKKNGFSGTHFCVLPENDFCFAVFGNLCYERRPTGEERDRFTLFHKRLLRSLFANRNELF